MRTISFKEEKYFTDPVDVGDILRVRRGNNWYTVISVNEVEPLSCTGCLFESSDTCNVPFVWGSGNALCCDTRCIFEDIGKMLEDL